MEEFFQKLEDEEYFCDLVRSHYEALPAQMQPIFECSITVDDERLRYAHAEYDL